jgi:hypothetical protein
MCYRSEVCGSCNGTPACSYECESGRVKSPNCTCEEAEAAGAVCCPVDTPYACDNRCYATDVCGSCNGPVSCEDTFKCDDEGYVMSPNCTCEEANADGWACCPADSPYVCNHYCYDYDACGSCNGPCAAAKDCNTITDCHTDWIRLPGGPNGELCNTNFCQPNAPAAGSCSTCRTTEESVPDGNCGTNYCDKNCNTACTNGKCNTPPTFKGLVIKNKTNTTVSAESGNKNQICDTAFSSSRSVTFKVGIGDSDGIADIKNVTLTWNGNNIPMIGSIGATTTFGITFPDNSTYNLGSTYPLIVTITDSINQTAVDATRYLKIWDCKVPISGTIYDGTNGASCPNTGFSITNPDALNLKNLAFKQNNIDFTMSINSDKTSYYSDSNNGLIWGSNIAVPQFNGDIALSNPILIKTLSSSGTSTCSNDFYVNTNTVDPYATSIGITADFTGILIQDPWWQAKGGGVISNTSVSGQVPVTCIETNNCVSQISIGGLVAVPLIENKGKSLNDAQTWYYSDTLAKLADYNTNYDYFYNQYFVKKAIGTTLVGKTINNINDLGSDTNGIYFINGDLNINGDIVNPNDFLMIIVKGDINVGIGTSQIDGILVANNINASGSSPVALIFNGSLYASNNVNFSRDFTSKVNNNTKPAVVVNYDPELIFNMPGDIAKVLTNWQWGN